MKERCKNCKYWEEETSIEWMRGQEGTVEMKFGSCLHEKIYNINKIKDGLSFVRAPYKDEAMLWDYEEYCAAFHPGPEFGCVHFEEA